MKKSRIDWSDERAQLCQWLCKTDQKANVVMDMDMLCQTTRPMSSVHDDEIAEIGRQISAPSIIDIRLVPRDDVRMDIDIDDMEVEYEADETDLQTQSGMDYFTLPFGHCVDLPMDVDVDEMQIDEIDAGGPHLLELTAMEYVIMPIDVGIPCVTCEHEEMDLDPEAMETEEYEAGWQQDHTMLDSIALPLTSFLSMVFCHSCCFLNHQTGFQW